MIELPFDLHVEILKRVPVKDIVRFRCVCKNWRLLFQDEKFISKHTMFAPSRFLVKDWDVFGSNIYKYDDRSGKAYMLVQDRELNEFEKQCFSQKYIVCHCNGLLCLWLEDHMVFVWNPSLRELRRILKIPYKINRYTDFHMGFGYDHSIQDYKIIMIPVCYHHDIARTNQPRDQAQILTLKSSPRLVDIPTEKNLYDIGIIHRTGTLVGSYIFWHFGYELGQTNERILSFDLVSEKFNYSSSPCTDDNQPIRLRSFRGSLCIMQHMHLPASQELIVTKIIVWCADHEEKDMSHIKSWSKLFRLELTDIERSIHCGKLYGVMIDTVTKAGEFFVQVKCESPFHFSRFKLFAYNFKKKEFRETNLYLSSFQRKVVTEYEATLVSIPNSIILKM